MPPLMMPLSLAAAPLPRDVHAMPLIAADAFRRCLHLSSARRSFHADSRHAITDYFA